MKEKIKDSLSPKKEEDYFSRDFIDLLAKMRSASVGEVIQEMNVLEIKKGIIQNPFSKDELLMKIFYTVDYLIENKLASSVGVSSHSVPSFNPSEKVEKNIHVSQIHATKEFLDKYWPMELTVSPKLYLFIEKKYQTPTERTERLNRLSPLVAVMLSTILTALVTLGAKTLGAWGLVLAMALTAWFLYKLLEDIV